MITSLASSTANDREAWLDERRNSIGASEAATVLGLNPFETRLELFLKKTGMAPETASTEAMELGHKLEPVIDELYQSETGRSTRNLGPFTIQRNAQFPWMHATLDRLINPCEGREMPGDLQCKSVGSHMRRSWEDDYGERCSPLYVQVQVQHELAVTKMEWGSIAAMFGGKYFVDDCGIPIVIGADEFWHCDVERNDDFIELLIEKCSEFMDCVHADIPPEPTPDDGKALQLLYPRQVVGKTIQLPTEATAIDSRIQRLKARAKRTREMLDQAENDLKSMIGDAERAELPSGGAYLWREQTRKAYEVAESTSRVLRRVKR